MKHTPAVSVVMPARNAQPYLGAAIESILTQSFQDFELIVRDDGSTDGTTGELREWAQRDSRVRLFEGEQLGLAGSSNWVVTQARAPFVARMDADDVARVDRLALQVDALQKDPSILLVGSLFDCIDAAGRRVRRPDRFRILRKSWNAPFAHSSIMFRRRAFDAVGGYRSLPYCEDWDLFLRLSNLGRVAVIADALVSHRVVATSASAAPERREVIQSAITRIAESLRTVVSASHYQPTDLTSPPPERFHPLAIIGSSSTALWAGGSPRPLNELLRRARLRPEPESAMALAWALLAEISPATLRLLLNGLSLLRDGMASRRVALGEIYEWRPGPTRFRRFVRALSAKQVHIDGESAQQTTSTTCLTYPPC